MTHHDIKINNNKKISSLSVPEAQIFLRLGLTKIETELKLACDFVPSNFGDSLPAFAEHKIAHRVLV